MSGDYISREAAKKELCERCSDFTMCTRSDNDCPITRGLNSLPAADVVEVLHERIKMLLQLSKKHPHGKAG